MVNTNIQKELDNFNIKLELETLTVSITKLVEQIVEQKLKENVVEIVTSIQENYKTDNTEIEQALVNFLKSSDLEDRIEEISKDTITNATIEIY